MGNTYQYFSSSEEWIDEGPGRGGGNEGIKEKFLTVSSDLLLSPQPELTRSCSEG